MTETSALLTPHLGFGLGLRKEHYEAVLPAFEVITENYLLDRGLAAGGKPSITSTASAHATPWPCTGCRCPSAGPIRSIGDELTGIQGRAPA